MTKFLAYSPRFEHPSRALAPADDVDQWPKRTDAADVAKENDRPTDNVHVTLAQILAKRDADQKEHESKYPLHHRINKIADPALKQIILDAFSKDPLSIRQKDGDGFTPMHVAAATANIVAVKILLELGAREDVLDRDNGDGTNALMMNRKLMENTREFAETISPSWQGYADDRLIVEAMLKRATGEDVGTDEQYIRSKKWGCTCGQCIGGWLSLQMIHRLCGTPLDCREGKSPLIPSRSYRAS